MSSGEIAPGRDRAWNLLEKLGEGDAGEVFLVESIMDRCQAILKRPCHNAFPSDIVRQAAQIEREGQIISALARLNNSRRSVIIPDLLDQSTEGASFTERFFIVITRAVGFSLNFLARVAHFRVVEIEGSLLQMVNSSSPAEYAFLQSLANEGKLPDLLLLRAISELIDFLETIHTLDISTSSTRQYGILWNDIKPEHIYWDPSQSRFTLIDWGNGQFLEQDGSTKDRQYSRMDDYRQLLEEMGRFVLDNAPGLHTDLAWPGHIATTSLYTNGILPLKKRIAARLQGEQTELARRRRAEADLLQSSQPTYNHYLKLEQIQRQVIAQGELPDYTETERFFYRLAYELISESNFDQFGNLCQQADKIPTLRGDKCRLLAQLAQIAKQETIPQRALISALSDDWASVLWEMRAASMSQPEPAWWDQLSSAIRELELGRQALKPLVALNRLVHALAASAQGASPPQAHTASSYSTKPQIDSLLHQIKNEILPRWTQTEPDPPGSGLEYSEIEALFDRIRETLPQAGETLINALSQPRAQVRIVMDAWEHQEFDTARRGLNRLLLWDPDWRRSMLADRAIQATSTWLKAVRSGPDKDEPLQDFVTRLELEGREIRNQVGPAAWLDALLATFKDLRKGADPTQVMMGHPEVRDNIAWLLELDPRRPLLASLDKPVYLERLLLDHAQPPIQFGVRECALGQGNDLFLKDPLDNWVPEARGSSARVFQGMLRGLSTQIYQVAVKVMRPDRAEYALPLFQEEVRILTLLGGIPGLSPLLECGFVHLDKDQQIPPEDRNASAEELRGAVLRFGLDSVHNFLGDIENRVEQGWLPYLALEQHQRADNLLLHCDTGYTRGRFLPILEGLRMAIQICDILEAAHARNIIYRDHKILHYYWQEEYNGISMIDWNIAKRFPQGLMDSDIQFDLVQFGARALHYILAGRPAPGALPLGPNRPEEIEAAERSYSVHWTYDDQRLPQDIKEILAAVLLGEYRSAGKLRRDLHQIFLQLSDLIRKNQEANSE